MAAQVRSVDFLPEIFQTPVNKQFLSATLDQLVQEPKFKATQGFIGQKVGPGVNPNDYYVVEPTASRTNYQLEPGVISLDPTTGKIDDAITYPGILDALQLQGAVTDNNSRLFVSDYYSWDPFVDFDKFVNYSQYYWLPNGPIPVYVSAQAIPPTETITVTRANGVYTFSGFAGNNPTITLARNGSYNFVVAQKDTEAVNYRVTNNGTSSWAIDYEPNPTLTLVRGNTYTFNLIQSGPYKFYIKTAETFGTTNIYSTGVTNNGATQGLVTFTVPQDAPDTLYYVNDVEFNLRGTMTIVDAEPGTGPGFWIQTQPGVSGRLPWSPNISDRDVYGVTNNGTNLGTVQFNVPSTTAQQFYTSMPPIGYPTVDTGKVDLVSTSVTFDQMQGQSVVDFLAANPTGIDGVTTIDGKTIIFSPAIPAAPENYNVWRINYIPDGFGAQVIQLTQVETAVVRGTGSITGNTLTITNVTLGTFAVGQLVTGLDVLPDTYITEILTGTGTTGTYTLNNSQSVATTTIAGVASGLTPLSQFSISSGATYVNTNWFKNVEGLFEQMPLLTATLDTLFYQDGTDPDIFGTINLIDEDTSASINVINDILGKKTYTSPNGVVFTNGLQVIFSGNVTPASYNTNAYYVEGVGSGIKLLPVSNFVTPETYTNSIYVPYDTYNYDIDPYNPSTNQGLTADYLTINRASPDLNPWTRSNRWFHIDTINYAAKLNNTNPLFVNAQRAKRPILEFRAGTRLFNFGTEGLHAVDIIDFTETDALSNVAGQTSYEYDGYSVSQGSLVIFAADTDPDVRNQIYQVDFIVPDPETSTTPVINLVATSYGPAIADQTTVCMSGIVETGLSYTYNGTAWIESQQKSGVNQAPLFDVYDASGYSFGDTTKYPSSNFTGCKLLSYTEDSTNTIDPVLGIPLKYFYLENIGDIEFTNNLYTDTFIYTPVSAGVTVNVSSGFVRQYSDRLTFTRELGWQTAVTPSQQRQQFKFSYDGTPLQLDILVPTNTFVPAIQIFINDVYQPPSTYTVTTNNKSNTTVINLTGTSYVTNDIIEVLVLSDQVSTQGFYEIPFNLENNPFNTDSSFFTLGGVRSHYATICENLLEFQGTINGPNNTRDLGDIVPYGQQILQHSSPLTLAGYFLRSQSYDIFASMEYNSRQYIKYKNKLLTEVTQLNIQPNQSISSILDQAILNITKNLTSSAPFYWSDMLPSGTNYTSNSTTVTPITTRTFNTVQTYDFTKSNYLGLLVYFNGDLLVRNRDYVVSPDAPKFTLTFTPAVGDVITINEYPNTAGSYVPNTPSKMGLYPKYMPEIYLDETYTTPTPVIQGHDGSVTIAFGDIRDQVLLEFEKRIYDNIKVDDNPIPLTTEEIEPNFFPLQTTALLPGFFRTTPYTYSEVNTILSESFLSWVGQNKVDYVTQDYQADNPFTYNYSQAANRIDNAEFLQGNWRGIYRYFYDTETPNTTPWEMLGFTEMPAYWEQRYGPAPYTSGNTVLWDDLEIGLVADPLAPYVLAEYARPGLSKIIPAGSEGELLPPTECVVGRNDPLGFKQSWKAGDGGPTQAAWWNSSSYPFAIMRLLALTKPAQFFSVYADRDLYRFDTVLGQYLYNGRYRLDASGVQIYGNGVSKASYINWIVDYNRQSGINSTTALATDLANLDVRLCYRMASFTDSQYLTLFTERAGPGSTNNSLAIPPTSYNLLFYKNQPFNQLTYSAIIVEQTVLANGNPGYKVYGYSNIQPYFETLVSSPVGIYQTITVADLTVQVPEQYTTNVVQIPYGYTFTNAASVCDFILSYGAYLESQGLVFDAIENGYTLDWKQMAEEFLYFAAQGWTEGTLINLNPAASIIKATQPISIVDTIASTTPENMLLDQYQQVLDVRTLVVNRDGNTFSITSNTGQTISFLTLRFTNYEDMIVLDNTTQYNDLIYDPSTGARQVRLNLKAFTTTEWDGQLNAQGFILNLNNVKQWEPYKKYTKGDIVLHKNTYWQALDIVQPQETFNFNFWVKSNYQLIDQGLLPNLANKANQLANTYDIYNANLMSDNDLFAFGLIGFRPRQYMSDMNLDGITQLQLYQQFLGTKGTRQAAQLFSSANLGKESGDYKIYENWAVLAGTYGAQANKSFFEIALNESLLNYNPSTIQIINPGEASQANQTVLLNDLWKESYKITSPNILPTTYEGTGTSTGLPSAGYVCLDDVDITVFSLADPTALDTNIDTIGIGTYVWFAKTNSYNWGVYRTTLVKPQLTQLSNNLSNTAVAQFNGTHGLVSGDLIIIKYFNSEVDGVYRVLSTPSTTSIIISYNFTSSTQTTITGTGLAFKLQNARVKQASDIATLSYVNDLVPGARVWIDNNGTGKWSVVEKQAPFITTNTFTPDALSTDLFGASMSQTSDTIAAIVGAPGTTSGQGLIYNFIYNATAGYTLNNTIALTASATQGFGSAVSIGNNAWGAVSAPDSLSGAGYVAVLYRQPGDSSFVITQLLIAPNYHSNYKFGTSVTISKDERWMYIGSPGNNSIYAYGKVDVESQSVSYNTNGTTTSFAYSNSVWINSSYPGQLYVTIDGIVIAAENYTVTSTNVVFDTAPATGQKLTIARNQKTQLDNNIYYNVQATYTSGAGSDATFTVTNIRGQYGIAITNPGTGYLPGDTLTINYSQINPIGTGSSANNLILTVTNTDDGGITVFTSSGTGVGNTSTFILKNTLATATNISSFVVTVNGQVQRPGFDYTFNPTTTQLTFQSGSNPSLGAIINVASGSYWQLTNTIISPSSNSSDNFGATVSTTTDGAQIFIGAPGYAANSISGAGTVYVMDRSVYRYQVTNPSVMTYAIPGTATAPINVSVNGTFLTNAAQFTNGQYIISGSNIVFSNISFTIGDSIEIGTNQFQAVQELYSSTPSLEANFGSAIDSCPLNCSVYIGAPQDSTYLTQAGSVDHQVNQSRVYGVTTSTIANPSFTSGGSIRVNNVLVTVPENSTIFTLIDAVNAANIPNVIATATPDLEFIGDGATNTFYIGSLYSEASSYSTLVYVNNVLQVYNSQYTYNSSTQEIFFMSAPYPNTVISVVSGRMTISVQNAEAATPNSLITVLPGSSTLVFTQAGFNTFVFTQQILSPLPTVAGLFGSSISVDTNAINLIVGSPNGNVYEPTTFDNGQTYFDQHSTNIYNEIANGGVAYTYDYFPSSTDNINNPGQFAFGQQIYNSQSVTGDRFGTGLNYTGGRLIVGAPGVGNSDSQNIGYLTLLNNPTNTPAWTQIRIQQPVVDVYQLDGVFSYNKLLNSTQTYFDFFDPLQGKILGVARSNIDYIGSVDPASYNTGSIHNNGNSWGALQVGKMWWDTDTVRFIDPNQDDIVYASRRWGSIFPGSRVDIYQWVESTVPPASYTGSGTPLSTTSYTISSRLGSSNIFTTVYYFWVRGITTIAEGSGKTLSASGVASYITDPRSSGLPYIAALNASTIAIYNARDLLSAQTTILSIGFDRKLNDDNIHQEYQLVADGVADAFLTDSLYRKLLDSLCGANTEGNVVPDPTLSPGERYGVQFRPRQSMFVDRFKALQNYLGRANTVLAQYPISEIRSFNLLNATQPTPSQIVTTIAGTFVIGTTYTILTVGTTDFTLIGAANNNVGTIFVATGPGTGTGTASTIVWNLTVANQEELSYQDLDAVPVGYKYLVLSDSTQGGLWTIYQVSSTQTLNLIQVQSYNTPMYWYYSNWYKPGYNSTIAPQAAVPNYSALATLSYEIVPIGASARVVNNGANKWEIYLRTGVDPINDWTRVGLEDGTIQFKEELWNYVVGGFGFDAEVFDSFYFDQDPVIETRYILRALNEEIYINELQLERNSSLMLMFNFAYTETTNPAWLVKTSLVDINHKIRNLEPYQTYLQDNQNFVLDYFTEVKPYHVQVRQFNLIYSGQDDFLGDLTDYDVPAYYDYNLEIPQYVSPILTPYDFALTAQHQSILSDAAPDSQIWLTSPWREWYNNYLLEIMGVTVVNGGSGYTVTPVVTVTGECVRPASMYAIINGSGRVSAVIVTDPGEGYTTTAQITITGGNGTGAVAVAQMGNNLVRSIKTTLKYDRYEYSSSIVNWVSEGTYTEGTQVRYENQVWQALADLPNSDDTNVVFDPASWLLVDAGTLSGVNRTVGYYTATANEPGLNLPLLIDGIDYPGVQVHGWEFAGNPAYNPALLDTIYESFYGNDITGPIPTGLALTDINVDGGAYVDTYSSHAPEELIPGATFDTLDLRVYTAPGGDWEGDGHGFPENLTRYTYTGDPISFNNQLPYPFAILVVNQTTQFVLNEGTDYTVDWATQTITIQDNTNVGDIVNIYVYELGGGNQLYKNTYAGNGDTLVVPVEFNLVEEFAIFVNGVPTTDFTFEDNSGEQFGTTLITFTNSYTSADFIALTAIGLTTIDGVTTNYSWSTPVTQYFTADGYDSVFNLTNSLEYTNPVNAIVNVDGERITTAAGIDHVGDGSTIQYACPSRLYDTSGIDAQGNINAGNIFVYINDILLSNGTDYVLLPYLGTGTTRNVRFTTAPAVGARIYIATTVIAQATINADDNTLTILDTAGNPYTAGSVISITTWNDLREQRMATLVFVGPVQEGYAVYEGFDTTEFDQADVTNTPGSFDYSTAAFLGTITTDSTIVTNVDNFTSVFVGAAVQAAGVPLGAAIAAYDTIAQTVTLTLPATATATDVTFAINVVQENELHLGRIITDISRLWVTLNGRYLAPNVDFTLSNEIDSDDPVDSGTQIILPNSYILETTDVLMVTVVTDSVTPAAMEFRIFQDMRGAQATYRMTPNTTTTLTQELSATADVIHVANARALPIPDFEANLWGVITIDGERIMYREIDFTANTVSSLLRGTAGTAADSHLVGANVYDMGRGNLLPVEDQNYIVSNTTLANGTQTVFVATDITGDSAVLDQAVEVYVGGTRVTTGYTITSYTPVTITFTAAPADGSDVTILVRRGTSWYGPGISETNGIPLQQTNTEAARFLRGL